MRLYCIGHKPPEFRLDTPFTFISPNTYPGFKQMVVPDDSYGPAYDGRILSEYTQLRALAEKLEQDGSDEPIHIIQYRRFLALREPRRVASNLPYAHAVRASEVPALFPSRSELAALDDERLVCPALGMSALAIHYAMFHPADDIAAFALALHEVDGFDRQRCREFLRCRYHFPAPSLGIMRPARFIGQMQVLMAAWAVFHAHYFVPRDGAQRRVGGFLLERLQSFMLYEEFASGEVEPVYGHLAIVSETDDIVATH